VRSATARDHTERNGLRIGLQAFDQIAHRLERGIRRHHERAVVDESERERREIAVARTGQSLDLIGEKRRRRLQ
jgi:hypothetical protein